MVYRAAVRRPVPPVLRALLRPAGPRLTAAGGGLLAGVVMLGTGAFVQVVLGTAPVFFGVVFLGLSVCCALWIRPADVIAAPIAMPIAFAAGTLALGEGSGALTSHVMAAGTTLALEAPWLYGGTLLAGALALLRHFALLAVRRSPGGTSGGTSGGPPARSSAGAPARSRRAGPDQPVPVSPPRRRPAQPPRRAGRGGAPSAGRR
ncbi:hypothetical protein O7599_13250 [Streptomyces sp. WMMC500]|uniref:DUF6542 domain-containing protein n=1 Tax=Streptomyces sp. WMMC500 TaxID=3015154 RepID=UPI00248C88AC|nr:DUF6542 domain-containing protein [Streptomyces sp. WMMC500]WBB63424.1 hypothetical protein O7599_13250 [Streptomyces sp. WMMC500]